MGCYCVRFGRLIFEAEPEHASARAFTHYGVDGDIAAILDFAEERRLVLSASMRRAPSTFTRIIGETGELRITNPFHPRPGDTVQRWAEGKQVAEWTAGEQLAFQHGVEHVHSVLNGQAEPRHLAMTDALGNARALDMILAAAQ